MPKQQKRHIKPAYYVIRNGEIIMNYRESEIIIESEEGKSMTFSSQIVSLSEKEKTIRSIKAAGMFVSLAIFSILIPVAHFLLVPAFLIAAPVAAWFKYNQSELIEHLKIQCPVCEGEIQKKSFLLKNVQSIDCQKCFTRLSFSIKKDSP